MGRNNKAKAVSETAATAAHSGLADTDGGDRHGPSLVSSLLRQAWFSLAFWMTFGLLLEGLIGYRIPDYLNDPQRRELFRLAHAHGNVLSLVLLGAALAIGYGKTQPARINVLALRVGVVVMPLSFLTAGVWHYNNDPGLAIWLVPPAALLVIFGVVGLALASRTR
jgi:hypothetical protein